MMNESREKKNPQCDERGQKKKIEFVGWLQASETPQQGAKSKKGSADDLRKGVQSDNRIQWSKMKRQEGSRRSVTHADEKCLHKSLLIS